MKETTGAGALYSGILVLVLAAVLLGIGITILDSLSVESRTDTTYTNDRFNASNTSCVALTNQYITASSGAFKNATDGQTITASCLNFDSNNRRSATCVSLSTTTSCNVYHYKLINASYTYGASTSSSTATTNVSHAVDDFAVWFSIIVVIVAAGIIIMYITRSFSKA